MDAIILPVGPGHVEVQRMVATSESVRDSEAERLHLYLVDDNPDPRPLAELCGWSGPITVLRTALWSGSQAPRAFDAMVAGSMLGFATAVRDGASFALKLDTDAIVIQPFASKIRSAFDLHPKVGIVGSCEVDCVGYTRPYRFWKRKLRRELLTRRALRAGVSREVSRALASAIRQPSYKLGQHCLGGAYAIGNGALSAVDWGRWQPWARLDISEDVIVSALVASAGFDWLDLTSRDQPFALAWQGLPASPDWIADRGHSIVHSVKCDSWEEEVSLRTQLKRAAEAARARAEASP